MKLIKRINRKIIAPILFNSKITEFINRFSCNSKLILNYHGIVKIYSPELSKNHLPLEEFEKQISYIKKKYSILPLEEIFKSKSSSKVIGITFDDGYQNNLTNAFPVLKLHNIPATVFVTAQALEKNSFPLWYDFFDISVSLIGWDRFKKIIDSNKLGITKFNSFNDYNLAKGQIKKSNSTFKLKFLDLLFKDNELHTLFLKANTEYWTLLNLTELEEISNSRLIEIGSHGLTHSNLEFLNDLELENELSKSKKVLEKAIGTKISSIAFPDGSYNHNVVAKCKELGYERMYAVNYRNKSEKNDPNLFRRFSISNTTTTESILLQVNLAFNNYGI